VGGKILKFFKLEYTALLLCALCVAFSAGWFARGTGATPIRVETEKTLSAAQTTLTLLAPEATAQAGTLLVNINTADVETLMTLPGVGETKANAIVAERAANGSFRHVEDITRVSGIGEGLLAQIIDYITVEDS